MSIQGTGTRDHLDVLELRRSFGISTTELWRYLVDSDYLDQWFGTWQGEPANRRVQVTLSAEEGSPTESVEIVDCDQRALHLEVRTGEGNESWLLELHIESRDEGSELVFRMPGLDPQMASSVGPGWEFYLDRLVAAVSGKDAVLVVFEPNYYPGLSEYYKTLFNSLTTHHSNVRCPALVEPPSFRAMGNTRTSALTCKENAGRVDATWQIPFEPSRGLECRVLS